MHPRLPTPAPTKPWLKSDLLFLGLSLENGMRIAEVAGFLARNEDEVREKAVELRREARGVHEGLEDFRLAERFDKSLL